MTQFSEHPLTSISFTWQLYSSLQIIVRVHRRQRPALKYPAAEENLGEQGSIRAPQWKGGGVVFAPVPRDYSFKLNKKEKRAALKSVLTDKVLNGNLVVVDELKLDEIKTKRFTEVMNNLKVTSGLVVIAENNENIVLSARNVADIDTTLVNTINVYDVLNAKTLVLTKESVAKIEEVYA